jgi:hypothetical protein
MTTNNNDLNPVAHRNHVNERKQPTYDQNAKLIDETTHPRAWRKKMNAPYADYTTSPRLWRRQQNSPHNSNKDEELEFEKTHGA